MSDPTCLVIDKLWDGGEALASEGAQVTFALESAGLWVEVAARFHGDPAPPLPPGRTDGLWNHEVVELFLANEKGEYLELEFGPHGHYLGLGFAGVRQLVQKEILFSYRAEIRGPSWRGEARVALRYLPAGASLANAYSIHGQGLDRRYLAAHGVPGSRPDFHQPHRFQPWQGSASVVGSARFLK